MSSIFLIDRRLCLNDGRSWAMGHFCPMLSYARAAARRGSLNTLRSSQIFSFYGRAFCVPCLTRTRSRLCASGAVLRSGAGIVVRMRPARLAISGEFPSFLLVEATCGGEQGAPD